VENLPENELLMALITFVVQDIIKPELLMALITFWVEKFLVVILRLKRLVPIVIRKYLLLILLNGMGTSVN
jgi:hypothetical protein